MEKARAGGEVRLIYDDVGCWHVPNRFLIDIVGDLYFPAYYDATKKYAAIIVGHPFGLSLIHISAPGSFFTNSSSMAPSGVR